jgi:hypothetical protein
MQNAWMLAISGLLVAAACAKSQRRYEGSSSVARADRW